jgi:cytochrome d ubiquinol oxidase subunit II
MIELWFGILCFMLIMFAVLEGWDFGAGALHLIVARPGPERRSVVAAIGPLWSWHEVWLVGAGGTFIVAFPKAMATAFSGYYLALWLALWCLMLRGISLEVGGHLEEPLWRSFWDVVFATANVLLAFVFGAALGNVIRGVPLDETGSFSLAFFTHFGVRGRVGLLDWYTLSVAIMTLLLVSAHGATYLTLKLRGVVHDRADRAAHYLWRAVGAGFPIVTVETWYVRPEMFHAALQRPLAGLGIAVVFGALVLLVTGRRRGLEGRAFIGSSALIAGLLAVLAVSVFPILLRSTIAPEFSLTAQQAGANHHGLAVALLWWPLAFVLAVGYMTFIARQFRGKVPAHSGAHAPQQPLSPPPPERPELDQSGLHPRDQRRDDASTW